MTPDRIIKNNDTLCIFYKSTWKKLECIDYRIIFQNETQMLTSLFTLSASLLLVCLHLFCFRQFFCFSFYLQQLSDISAEWGVQKKSQHDQTHFWATPNHFRNLDEQKLNKKKSAIYLCSMYIYFLFLDTEIIKNTERIEQLVILKSSDDCIQKYIIGTHLLMHMRHTNDCVQCKRSIFPKMFVFNYSSCCVCSMASAVRQLHRFNINT